MVTRCASLDAQPTNESTCMYLGRSQNLTAEVPMVTNSSSAVFPAAQTTSPCTSLTGNGAFDVEGLTPRALARAPATNSGAKTPASDYDTASPALTTSAYQKLCSAMGPPVRGPWDESQNPAVRPRASSREILDAATTTHDRRRGSVPGNSTTRSTLQLPRPEFDTPTGRINWRRRR